MRAGTEEGPLCLSLYIAAVGKALRSEKHNPERGSQILCIQEDIQPSVIYENKDTGVAPELNVVGTTIRITIYRELSSKHQALGLHSCVADDCRSLMDASTRAMALATSLQNASSPRRLTIPAFSNDRSGPGLRWVMYRPTPRFCR